MQRGKKEATFTSRPVVASPILEELFSNTCDKAAREMVYQAVRCYHHKLREVGNHLGPHLSAISVTAKRGAETVWNRT